MIRETQKILDSQISGLQLQPYGFQTMRSHCESINVETERALTPEGAVANPSQFPGVKVGFSSAAGVPHAGNSYWYRRCICGRIRTDLSVEHGLNLWVVGDQIRKGAALNAVQIAEHYVQQMG